MSIKELALDQEQSLQIGVLSDEDVQRARVQQEIGEHIKRLLPHGCKRVLLLTPPESPENNFNMPLVLGKRYPCFPPYGIGILARQLENRGYSGAIVDLNFHVLRSAHRDQAHFRFRIWEDVLREKIDSFKPDLIGISVMFTIAMQSTCDVAAFLKKNYPGIPLIAGGICVSNDIERVLRDVPEIDVAGFFEGDCSFPDLLDVANGKLDFSEVRQFAMLKEGELLSTRERATPSEEQIDVEPEYYDLPIGEYSQWGAMGAYNFLLEGKASASIISNRGCRARCAFCAVRNFMGMRVRSRSVKGVVDEMEHMLEKYGVTHFTWLDDDLLKDEKRAIALFQEISRRKLGITWDATNGLIAAAITPELMSAAAESGCIGFHLGLESGNDKILRAVHKPGNAKAYRRAKEIISQYPHVFVKGYTIIGFPQETVAEIANTVSFFRELQFEWYPLQLLTPLPGTEITYSMVEQGLIRPPKEATYRGLAAGSKRGSGGSLRQREITEKKQAREFRDLLAELPPDHVPTAEELDEIWFVADYRLNYEKILDIDHPAKLGNIELMMRQLTDEYTTENALGNLFLGVIASKLGNIEESNRRLELAERYRDGSAYWAVRFQVLGMDSILAQTRNNNIS